MAPRAVVVVAASPFVGEGLKSALAGDPSLQVVDTLQAAGDVDWAAPPDAVVAAAADREEAAELHHALAGRVPLVLVCDAQPALPWAHDAAGVPLAVLAPAATPAQLRAALHAVLAGLHAWSTEIDPNAASPGPTNAGEPKGEPLTPRELEVFELLAKGLSNRDIGAALGISPHTAKFHVAQILAKIGAATRAEAVAIGLRLGLIGI